MRVWLINMATSAAKQVLLYQYSVARPRLFLLISTAAGIQLVFWSYLSVTALTDYRHSSNQPSKENKQEKDNSSNKLMELLKEKSKSLKWRVGLSLLAMSLGTFFTFTSILYPKRTVHKMMYNVSKQTVQLTTYSPSGSLSTKEVSSANITRYANAQGLTVSQLALKVKGHSLYYLLDKRGTFTNPKLFDMIIARKT